MTHYSSRHMRLGAIVGAALSLVLIGVGCQNAGGPKTPPPPPAFDVSTTTCPQIPDARQKVAQSYEDALKTASDAYVAARAEFQASLDACLSTVWKGGPCDKEYEATQTAYKNAWGDISNDQFYKEWKAAKADWDGCYGNYEAKQKEWIEKGNAREKECKDAFQTKVDAAHAAYDKAAADAKAKRDADNAFLDALEKECNKPKPAETNANVGVIGGGSGTTGGTGTVISVPGGTTYQPRARACQDYIPGQDGTPRTGQATDFGPKDILINLATQIAEDVTGTPLPTSAINDQIFAGIVCAKIHSRLIELRYEELDVAGNGRAEQAVRQKIRRYEQARSVWCGIAQGKPPVQTKKDAAAVAALPDGACKSDADCGTPVCCSNNVVGTLKCVVSTGACVPEKKTCDNPLVCGGNPAQCVKPPVKARAIKVQNHYVLLSDLHTYSNPEECDGEEHWHSNFGGSNKATDGVTVSEDHGNCGYGKVSEKQVYEVLVPAK